MPVLKRIKRELGYKRLSRSTAAIAGITSAASVSTGALAAMAAPTGLSAISVMLGISSAPFIVTAAPIVAGIAAGAGVAAGVMRFYSWRQECRKENEEDDQPRSDDDFSAN